MRRLSTEKEKRDKKDFSNIQIEYNRQFPFNDIFDVLYPLFGQYYPYNDFIYTIYSVNHIFCAYDKETHQSIACALLNNETTQQGGLYLMLFGVRQSNQTHGIGTH